MGLYMGDTNITFGLQGKDGEKGDPPVKGIDYWTPADKNEMIYELGTEINITVKNAVESEKGNIVDMLITELQGLPVFGVVDENNIIKITSQLSDGEYVLKYENEDDTYSEIGTITIGNGESGVTTYDVDIASIGYTDNARWSISSGDIRTGATGYTAINLIPITRPEGKTVTIELSGITWKYASNTAILPYNGENFVSTAAIYFESNHDYTADTGVKVTCNDDGSVIVQWSERGDYTGFKFTGFGNGANAKITVTIQ